MFVTYSSYFLSDSFSTALLLNNDNFNAIPFGIRLYFENQFRKLIVSFFKVNISSFFKTFFILKVFLSSFSNSSHTTPVIFDFPNGTITKSPIFNIISLS